MPLRFKLQLVVMADDNQECIEDVVVLDKRHERLEHIGLSLAEAKTLVVAGVVIFGVGGLRYFGRCVPGRTRNDLSPPHLWLLVGVLERGDLLRFGCYSGESGLSDH